MSVKRGSLSINSENIFPIIKKWLYSDHDIFVRELVSNGCDAITKLRKLEVMGEYSFPDDYKAGIQVVVNPEEKTLKFIDNGIGMTADEVEEYITQIAFSGATEFLEKYKDKTTDDQMIGHFGLGFYSAFMVADEVHIDTLSYKEGSEPVHWTCDGGTEYELVEGNKTEPGTEITLFLNEESVEFANEYRMREVIEKYCSFMPVDIYLSKEDAPQEYETIDEADLRDDDVVVEHIHEDAKTEEKENENGEKEIVEVSPAREKVKINKRPVSLSDTKPLWTKHPNECTDEEYKEFYRKVFMDYKEPLFWIHLNAEYPFNLKGILYFPKLKNEFTANEGVIKLARKYSFDKYGKGRGTIITLKNSFHGRTITTLTATGQDVFHNYFFPFDEGFRYARAGSMDSVQEVAGHDVCAVMLELVQGEGGVLPMEPDFVHDLALLCAERDWLLLVDEVQTGIGRTGTLFAFQQYGILPDAVSFAKGIAGGLPMGGFLASDRTRAVLGPGTHATTFGGNPVACAGALEVLGRIDEKLLAEVAEKGAYITRAVEGMPHVVSVEGKGLMLGVTLEGVNSREAAAACLEKGLIILTAKAKLRMLPPLTITYPEIDEGLKRLKEVLEHESSAETA